MTDNVVGEAQTNEETPGVGQSPPVTEDTDKYEPYLEVVRKALDEDPKVTVNVKLAAGRDPVTYNGHINMGLATKVILPSEDMQRAGFYTPHAQRLCNQFPGIYKPIVPKGGGE